MFEEGSNVALRTASYGGEMEELHVIVFSLSEQKFKEKKLSENVFVYPTNSFSRWLFVLDAIRLGKKIIREKKFVRGDSVVTCQDPFECGFVGWRIAKHFRLPLHLQIHTDFLSSYFKNSFFQRFRVFVAKFLLPKAMGVRVVSKRIADSINEAGIRLKREPRILPIRIDVESIEKENGADLAKMFPQFKFIVFMASRLTKEKRVSDAVEAFAEVSKKYPYAGLVIAGDGPLRKNLEQKSLTLGVDKNVVFLGWRDDITALMKSAGMFLSVSEFEGYGMSVVEAGLSKCPVLSTNVGLSGSVLVHKKNSYICSVGDIICIRDGISAFIGDNVFRYNMAQNLYSDVSSGIPSKENYVHSYVEILKETLK